MQYESNISKAAKNGGFCEELLNENDFVAVLANFCCYGYGANASETVQEIAIDKKRLSQMLPMCYSLLNSQSILISNSKERLTARTPLT